MYAIEIQNLDKVTATLTRFPKQAAGNINDAIRAILITIQREATKEAPSDTGKMRGDWDMSFGHLTGSLRNRSQYAVHMEYGTRPHFPPLEAITPWANRHGIPPFLVARAIARKGTKARRFFGTAIDRAKASANRIFDQAITKTLNEL